MQLYISHERFHIFNRSQRVKAVSRLWHTVSICKGSCTEQYTPDGFYGNPTGYSHWATSIIKEKFAFAQCKWALMAYSYCRNSDFKPDGYIVLCRSFHIGLDPDLDPYWDGFPNGYWTNFRDGCPPQGQMSIPILLYFNQGTWVRIWTNGEFLHSTVIWVRIWVQQCK